MPQPLVEVLMDKEPDRCSLYVLNNFLLLSILFQLATVVLHLVMYLVLMNVTLDYVAAPDNVSIAILVNGA